MRALRRVRKALARREYPVVPAHLGRLDYGAAEILVGVTSRAEILSRLRPAAKEPWTVRWIERSLRDGDVLYDVGANVGAYSLIAAALDRAAQVVAIEPASANYAALCDNVRLNGWQDRIVPLPVALAEETRLRTLGSRDVSAGAAGHALDDGAPAALPVLAYRLDDLIAQAGLPAPTLLKLDVDGGEAAVLRGGPATLADARLRSVLAEIQRDCTHEVVQLLEQAGLGLKERVDDRDGERLRDVWYGIFERG